MSSTNKIALVEVTLCEADRRMADNPYADPWQKEAHLRYTAWANKRAEPFELQRERVVLVYEDMSLDDILSEIKYEYSCHHMEADWGMTSSPKKLINVRAHINLNANFEVTYLGDYEDIACYCIMLHNEPPAGHYFGISQMPIYGCGSGFYHNSTVLQSFERASVTHAIHDGDRAAERKLFEFVDKEVQERFLPKPQEA
jgi:hypothetical protein